MDINFLEHYASKIRKNTFKTIHEAQTGHYGGSLSIIELLTYIYNEIIILEQKNINSIDRDLFVLSKGHAVPPIYEILKDKGMLDDSYKLREINSPMQGHPDKNKCSGIDASTGSLGQGLSTAVGMAYGQKLKSNNKKTFVIVGDGELQEGICFEALNFAATKKLNNLVVIIDNNKLQLMGNVKDVTEINYELFFKSLGAKTQEINGHSFKEIDNAFKNLSEKKLNIIIANTIKGKGVSFMENNYKWHGSPTTEEDYIKGLKELEVGDEKGN